MAKNFTALLDDVRKAIKVMPERIGAAAVKFSKDRFVKQNWLDESEVAWDARDRARRGGKARQKGAVLVDSGRLKRSIRVVSASKEQIVIGTDVPYARIHNEGLEATVAVKEHTRKRNGAGKPYLVRAHTRRVKMLKRQFLGNSQALSKIIEDVIKNEIEKAINQ